MLTLKKIAVAVTFAALVAVAMVAVCVAGAGEFGVLAVMVAGTVAAYTAVVPVLERE